MKGLQTTVQQREQFTTLSLLTVSKEGLLLNRLLANRLITEIGQLRTAFELSANQKLLEIMMAAEEIAPVMNSYSWQNKEADRGRVIRDLYYLNQIEQLEAALELNKNPQIIDHVKNTILVEMFFIPFDLAKFLQLPKTLQYQAFATLIRRFQIQRQSWSKGHV